MERHRDRGFDPGLTGRTYSCVLGKYQGDAVLKYTVWRVEHILRRMLPCLL